MRGDHPKGKMGRAQDNEEKCGKEKKEKRREHRDDDDAKERRENMKNDARVKKKLTESTGKMVRNPQV